MNTIQLQHVIPHAPLASATRQPGDTVGSRDAFLGLQNSSPTRVRKTLPKLPRGAKKAFSVATAGTALLAAQLVGARMGAMASPLQARDSVDILFVNDCPETVWPAALSSGAALPFGGGWAMPAGSSIATSLAGAWDGRFWGRTGCEFDDTGHGACETGDCGGALACDGVGGQAPATLAEFDFDGWAGNTFFDISLVDGFNMGLSVKPMDASCDQVQCALNVNLLCPPELQVHNAEGSTVACFSACEGLGGDAYCCTGPNSTPATCPPTAFSQIFKQACPQAYSYAYDDQTSTNTCQASAYEIHFCAQL